MNEKTVVVLGTSRDGSNTAAAIAELCPFKYFELIDLRNLNIAPYNYDGKYSEADDFIKVVKIMSQADNIVFATPVYWYSMSAILKNFFDRFSDLISIQKSLGRSLKGKKTYLISTGSNLVLPKGFEEPFKLTSEYFEMTYQGAVYKCVK